MSLRDEKIESTSTKKQSLRRDLTFHFIFAVIAIVLNIGFQFIVIWILPVSEITVLLSIFVGTAMGLIGKYLMDKFLIYGSSVQNTTNEVKDFGIYTLTGAFTTLIFWAVEYGFHLVFQTDNWRYFGGILGLIIGYTIKFFMDRRMVFKASG